jgi:hypothetical protein
VINIVRQIAKQFLLSTSIILVSIANTQADVNFTSWGGVYQASQQKAYANTWSKGSVDEWSTEYGRDQKISGTLVCTQTTG